MKTIVRLIQFIISGICVIQEMLLQVILKFYIGLAPILAFLFVFAILIGARELWFFWGRIIEVAIILAAMLAVMFIGSHIGDFLGFWLNENGETAEIYKRCTD